MTDQEAHEILERNGYAKHSDAITCVQDACDQGFVEGRASRQEEVERLKKALRRAKEQFSRINRAPASWSNEDMCHEARIGLEQIKEDLGEL